MLTLITGGSKNGKSHIAEEILAAAPAPHYYIATMEPYGSEAAAAIKRHRDMRAGKGFETVEKYTDLQELSFPRGGSVLLECMCNLCANEMFSANCREPAPKILSGVKVLLSQISELVIVTNEVGDDGRVYGDGTMEYIRQLGNINAALAAMADNVIEAVYGIALYHKRDMRN
ncbi:MAG: bifunctional adenosylcobinamide kinase/adenosylcobinamide-phosphate guanylyltransferase [Lachnospiraceae bacterium]|nr:bifunctional adenosylcobinamide kinase/adenosylcobinamide-phosphate guanylyltransferase [Lachnospiraceae bacterium]